MDLTSNDYYTLNCSVIPDNVYKQILGVIKEIEYEGSSSYDSPEYLGANIVYMNGSTFYSYLPLFDITDDSEFARVYLVNGNYTNDGAVYPTTTRTEMIRGKVPIEILSDVPIKYNADNPVTVSSATGTKYKREQSNVTGIEGIWGAAFDDKMDRIYGLEMYNTPGSGTFSQDTIDYSQLEVLSVTIDSTYDGSKVDVYTGKFILKMDVAVSVYKATMHNVAGFRGNTSELNVMLVRHFTLNVPYYQATEKDVEFEYHVNESDYREYPLKINGNYLTTKETLSGTLTWDNAISQALLNKYSNGKLWINAKVKASFLIDNNCIINSIVNVKKLDNTYILNSNLDVADFEIKNIEYTYNDSQFIADIVLLEV